MSERKTDQKPVRLTTELSEWIERVAKETNKSVAEVLQAALQYTQDSKWKP